MNAPVIEASSTSSKAIHDLRNYVRYYDDALPREFCAQLIQNFELATHLQMPHGKGHQPGLDSSGWTELDVGRVADAAFMGFFHSNIDKFLAEYNRQLGLSLPIPPSAKLDELRIKRYRAGSGENFQPHFDAYERKSARYLVFLWYLNDVSEGGETAFVDLDVKVAPRAGRLLVFPPYWMYQHAGLPPVSNDKYIISTYLMF